MASRDKNSYFIITARPISYSWMRAGSICYLEESHYTELRKKDTVSVICIGSSVKFELPRDILQPLTRQKAEFLLALDDLAERLNVIVHPEVLEQAAELTVDSDVIVEQKNEWLKGVVRYIGPFEPKSMDPIAGVFFGVELQVSSSLLCLL